MDQPVLWTVLAGVVVLAAAVRLGRGRALVPAHAVALAPAELWVAGVAALALVVHCSTMFFAPWTDPLPGGRAVGEVIRGMGAPSHVAYWLPAALLVLALRRVWWPALVLLVVVLAGVGATMFWPYPLATHLVWITAAVLTLAGIASSLVGIRRQPAQASAVAH